MKSERTNRTMQNEKDEKDEREQANKEKSAKWEGKIKYTCRGYLPFYDRGLFLWLV